MIVTFKYFCSFCGNQYEIKDWNCENCGCPTDISNDGKAFTEIRYSHWLNIFNRKTELVEMPKKEFNSMIEKESWISKQKALLREKYFAKKAISEFDIEKKGKARARINNLLIFIAESWLNRNKK